jgi:cyclase
MKKGLSIGFLLPLLAIPVARPAAAEEAPEVTATKVSGNVWVVEGQGGNIGVSVGPDGILIVDDQFAPLAEAIVAAIRKVPGSPREAQPRFVLNTHWHGDHTGGNRVFGRTGTIVAQTNVRKRLAAGQMLGGEAVPAEPKEGLPVVTFDESLSIHWNGEEIVAVHQPRAHTDGDAVIRFTGSNVVHMGDLFFNGLFPFIDAESGGTLDGYLADVESVLRTLPPGAKVIAGHGPVGEKRDLERFLRMLRETSSFVRKKLAAGAPLDRIVAEGLPAEWTGWAHPFIDEEKWIRTIASFTKGKPER